MCGIAGILDLDSAARPDEAVLARMLESIFHRGPDESGRLVDGPLAMGMRRLSIIDLADGKQPIFDEQGRFGVIFNGEIYNYRELREELMGRGHQLKTKSDTEVIVHLYEEHGPACVEHLRGMFGFAVWDNQQRELFIARDRMGIKPLYYTIRNNKFIFGSEIKAILAHPEVSAGLDHRALSEYLSLKYVPAPRTLFAGIHSLPPAHQILIRDGNVDVSRYWDVSFANSTDTRTDEECTDELLALLRESVRLRLRSDVPFGAFLSGGLDSSTIVALMSEALDEPVQTFSVGFASDREDADELPYAKVIADRFGCVHRTFKITAQNFLDYAEHVLWHLDQPIADQATVATHMVAKLARQHVKMVLTGEGGDELFAGYARYQGEQWSPWVKPIPRFMRPMLCRFANFLPGMRRAKIAFNALMVGDEADRFANWFPLMSDDAKAEVLSSSMSEYSAGAGSVFAEHLSRTDGTTPLDRMLYVDSKLWLPDYLLLRGDKLTMANSLEARVPLLDHKLVEFAARLPDKMKLRGSTRKWLLKQAASRLIPQSIIDRKKAGFPIPIDQWLRHEAREMMRDLLAPDTIRARGLFNQTRVQALMHRHESGYADHSTELWGLMTFEMWMRQFVDSQANASYSTPAATNTAGA